MTLFSLPSLRLFLTAFIQVCLVSGNTFFIANLLWPGIAIAGFGISWFWTSNVRSVAFGGTTQRLIYSTGAMFGGICGVVISKIIVNLV